MLLLGLHTKAPQAGNYLFLTGLEKDAFREHILWRKKFGNLFFHLKLVDLKIDSTGNSDYCKIINQKVILII